MVLHVHQANPHVHLSVAEAASGKRLNPRKADLQLWRETFAEKLRGWGIDAEATRQASRGESRNFEPLWRIKAKEEGRLRVASAATKTGRSSVVSRADAMRSWAHIMKALAASEVAEDRQLAERVGAFVRGTTFVREQFGQGSNAPSRQHRSPGEFSPLRADRSRSSYDVNR
jgi:hypothetical protein